MWPEPVVFQFNIMPPNATERDYFGPYNKLLHLLFPPDGPFTVAPLLVEESRRAIIVVFQILRRDELVLILELRHPSYLGMPLKRKVADEEIRSRMTDTVATCPLETLYAISALGTKLCFYSLNTQDSRAKIVPAAISGVNNVVPANRWDHDVLEASAEARLREIVEQIVKGCT